METSRITIIRTPKDNGMTAYSLQYNPPVSFGKGKAIRQERLNIESYTNPKNEVEMQFNQHVEIPRYSPQYVSDVRRFP